MYFLVDSQKFVIVTPIISNYKTRRMERIDIFYENLKFL